MSRDEAMLELAHRHLVEAKARIERQQDLIVRLRRDGHPTELAEQLLRSMLDTRDQMQVHSEFLEAQARET